MKRLFNDHLDRILESIDLYLNEHGEIPGLSTPARREAFAKQCIDSMRRVQFVRTIQSRDLDPKRADPTSDMFDPIRAAVMRYAQGDVEEASWLVFLATHFGRHRSHGWKTTAQVYAGEGSQNHWTYVRVSNDVDGFLDWLGDPTTSISRHVGNHRKYVSLSATKPSGTGATISSYLDWVKNFGSQAAAFQSHIEAAEGDECIAFGSLYKSMENIIGFGRTARFDFLCMLQKVGIANIAADRAYLEGATGPLRGSALLFRKNPKDTKRKRQLDDQLCDLGRALGFPPNIMEDAVCNWQKLPEKYAPFRG